MSNLGPRRYHQVDISPLPEDHRWYEDGFRWLGGCQDCVLVDAAGFLIQEHAQEFALRHECGGGSRQWAT